MNYPYGCGPIPQLLSGCVPDKGLASPDALTLKPCGCNTVRSGRIDSGKVLREEIPADLFTEHSLARDTLMKLTALFGCRFASGRAAAAPHTRTITAPTATMAEATAVDEAVAEPFMPHVSVSRAVLNRLYPDVTVPAAVAAEDGNGLEDVNTTGGLEANQRPGASVCRAGAQAEVGQ